MFLRAQNVSPRWGRAPWARTRVFGASLSRRAPPGAGSRARSICSRLSRPTAEL